jgi:ketosteroid isomerase-like protein
MVAEHEHVRVANVTLVRRFIEAINDSWNVDVMRELVSDDFLFMIPFAPEWFQVLRRQRERARVLEQRQRSDGSREPA